MKRPFGPAGILFAVVFLPMAPALGVVRYCDPDAPPGGTGLSWASPYNDLQTAINACGAGDELRLGQGTYRLAGARSATFTMKQGVIIRGGYWGYGGAVPDNRSFGAFPAVLTGDIGANDGANFANNGENAYHVVTVPAGMTSGLLDEVTITGGNASAVSGDDRSGGGIIAYGSMEFYNCKILANSAALGGGVRTAGGIATFTLCKFHGNRSTSTGGGAAFLSTRGYFTNCLFLGNTANSGLGGAIVADGLSGACLVVNCAFRGNAASQGGSIYCNSIITLTNCTFVQNSATSNGGAVFAGGGTYTNNCIFWGNTAPTGPQIGWTQAIVSYSNVQGGFAGTGNINADPYFVDLDGVDGVSNTLDDNFRIGPGSPCIDAGNSNVDVDNTVGGVQGLPGADLYGYTRRTDNPAMPDTGAGAPVVDMGAHEHFHRPALHVTNQPGFDYREGGSWLFSMGLRQALEAAARPNAGIQEIRVAGQVFRPAGPNGDRTARFVLPGGVKVTGGWEAFGAPGNRDPNTWITVFDGDLNANDSAGFANTGENSYRVLHVPAGTDPATTILDGVRIRGANASVSGMIGGGIEAQGAATFQNCTIYANQANDSGAGAYVPGGTRFLNCRIFGNQAALGKGGGIYSGSGTFEVTNCAFSGNSARSGGGLYGNATVVNSTFVGNTASQAFGGAGVNMGGAIYNSILVGNLAMGSPNPISGAPVVQYSAIEGGRAGIGNIANASFVDPDGADNVIGTLDDDLRQAAGSPTIDAASNALVPADTTDLDADGRTSEWIPFDVAMQPRFQDVLAVTNTGVGPGNIVDMGAYEAAGCVFNCGPPRVITAWKSVRTHAADGELAITLDPSKTGNGATGPTVEPRIGGIEKIVIEFDQPVTLRDATLITVTGRQTVFGFLNPPNAFPPSSVTLVTPTRLELVFAPGYLWGESCYHITLPPDTIWEAIPGDNDCRVRALAGDSNGDGTVDANDLAATKALVISPVSAVDAPRHDLNCGGGPINLGDVLFIRSRLSPYPYSSLCQ